MSLTRLDIFRLKECSFSLADPYISHQIRPPTDQANGGRVVMASKLDTGTFVCPRHTRKRVGEIIDLTVYLWMGTGDRNTRSY